MGQRLLLSVALLAKTSLPINAAEGTPGVLRNEHDPSSSICRSCGSVAKPFAKLRAIPSVPKDLCAMCQLPVVKHSAS